MHNNEIILAQIGCGYWGPNLLRNFSAQKNCRVRYVVDPSEDRRGYVESNFPRTKAVADIAQALADPELDGVIVATPAATHFAVASQALAAGKHAFVEKPLAMNPRESRELGRLSQDGNRILMIGHTFLYNSSVRFLKTLIDANDLGTVYYIYAQRLNLGVIRSDVNAMWNLAPHDISIIMYLLGGLPLEVSATGSDYIQKGIEDVVFMNLLYSNKTQAHIHVSWLDPNKVRKLTVVGSRKMVVYDDVADDKITIYDKGIDRKEMKKEMVFDHPVSHKLVNRVGDILMPRVESKEPLNVEAAHFLDCIRTGSKPLSDAANGIAVVDVLAAAQESLDNNGKIVTLGAIG